MLESQLRKDEKPSHQEGIIGQQQVEEVAVVKASAAIVAPTSDVHDLHTTPVKKEDESQMASTANDDRVV